ncbi:MAG: Ig-like domain-containing protein [Burkholderiaceae bacterium]
MALILEATSARGVVQRLPLEIGRNRFPAEPGTTYRIVDDSSLQGATEARVKRVGDDLIIEDLPDRTVVEFESFFTRCPADNACNLAVDGLGAPVGTQITPASQPLAAMPDGGFLMYSTAPLASSITPMSAEGLGTGVKIGGLALVGVGLAAAGGGGGGGGGGGSSGGDGGVSQSVSITSATQTNDATPLIAGRASSNARLSVAISSPDMAMVSYGVTANADGNWTLDTGAVTPTSASRLPAGGLPDGSYTVTVRSIENNAAAEISRQLVIDTFTPAPTIDAIAADNLVSANEKAAGVTVSGTAEAGTSMTVSIGAISQTVATDAGGRWSTHFASGQLPGDGAWQVRATAADAFGNLASAERSIVIAAQNPGVLISDDLTTAAANHPVLLTFSFSEAVQGFTASDITVSGGTAGAFTAIDASTYTLTVTPTPGQGHSLIVTVPQGATTSEASGSASSASTHQFAIDTVAPTLDISDNASGSATNQAVLFTFTFNEPVTGFTASDITVTGGGTVGSLTGNGSTYHLLVNLPTGNSEDTISVSVSAGAALDAGGNPSGADSQSQRYDTVAPTLDITSDGGATAHGRTTFTFTFSESMTGFTLEDIALDSGTVVGQLGGSGAVYTLLVDPPGNNSGTMNVSVAAGSAIDAAGNALANADTLPQPFDTRVPPPSLSGFVDNVTNAHDIANGPVTFTLTFDQAVTGLGTDPSDLSVTNGRIDSVTPRAGTNGSTYDVVVTPANDVPLGDMTLTVDAGAVDGVYSPGPVAAASHGQAIDTRAPVNSLTTQYDLAGHPMLTLNDVLDTGPMTAESITNFARIVGGAPQTVPGWSPGAALIDSDATTGQTYSYSVVITDLAGNVTDLRATILVL